MYLEGEHVLSMAYSCMTFWIVEVECIMYHNNTYIRVAFNFHLNVEAQYGRAPSGYVQEYFQHNLLGYVS